MCRVNVLAMFLYDVRKMKETGVFICQVQVLTLTQFKVTNCALGHSTIYSGTVMSKQPLFSFECCIRFLLGWSGQKSNVSLPKKPINQFLTSSDKADNRCLELTVLIYIYCALGPVSVHGAGLHGLRQPPLTTQDWLHGHIRRFKGYSFHITTILKVSSSVWQVS